MPGGHGGDAQPAGVERAERDRQALALAADEPVGVDHRAVPVRGDRRDGVQPHLLLGLAERQALDVARREEARDAAAARPGAGEERVEVDLAAVGDPRLRAGDPVARRRCARPCTRGRRRRTRPAARTASSPRAARPRAAAAASAPAARACRRRRSGGRRGPARSPRRRPPPTGWPAPPAPAGTPRRAGRRRPTPPGRAAPAGPPRRAWRTGPRGRSRRARAPRPAVRAPCRRCRGRARAGRGPLRSAAGGRRPSSLQTVLDQVLEYR